MKEGKERVLTKRQALKEIRAEITKFERDYNNPIKRKEVGDAITDVDKLFDFYKTCEGYGIKMRWTGFNKMWDFMHPKVRNKFYNYVNELKEREYREIGLMRLKLAKGLISAMSDNETLVEKVIQFNNDDVPRYLRELRRAERISLEYLETHPRKFMTYSMVDSKVIINTERIILA